MVGDALRAWVVMARLTYFDPFFILKFLIIKVISFSIMKNIKYWFIEKRIVIK